MRKGLMCFFLSYESGALWELACTRCLLIIQKTKGKYIRISMNLLCLVTCASRSLLSNRLE